MNIESLIEDIEWKLASLKADYEGLSLREKVLRLTEILKSERKLNIAVVKNSGCDANGGRERLRLYLTQNVGITIDALELEVVSGISEYGRRIRELRVQDGYKILSGLSNDPEEGIVLKSNQYLLLRKEPDMEAARRWHLANRIRKRADIGAQERILIFLQSSVGQIVTSEEIQYVAKVSEFGRRARELRTEQGFAVATRFTGRPDLKAGEYVLESVERVAEAHDRHIPEAVQKEVFERDGNACRNCGWQHEMWTRQDPRFLELHHFEHHAAGGKNNAANLLVLCNRCHDQVHAGRITVQPLNP